MIEFPMLKFTVTCNGSTSGDTIFIPQEGGRIYRQIPPSGNKYWTSSAMYTKLFLDRVGWLYEGEVMFGVASLEIDGMMVGRPSPWCCWVGPWPQGPAGLLHWLSESTEWNEARHIPTELTRRYSLLTEVMK